ncbi:MAG: hypothetical protein HY329_06200 [Chloroflexi bacterium]|nr:hypothetical protein [Chloroflexota bacterium]
MGEHDRLESTTAEGPRITPLRNVPSAPLGSRIVGEATPIHVGRRTQVWQTRISSADGKLVAVVTQTQMVI